MPKVLITGSSATGKSTVIEALHAKGYTAYNMDDEPSLTRLEVKTTGEPVEWPKGNVDWQYYSWNWDKAKLKELLASDKTVFFGGIASNQEEFFSLFDTVITLTVSLETFRHRLETRTQHPFSQQSIEQQVLNYPKRVEYLTALGVIAINSDCPLEETVANVLQAASV